MERPAHCSRLRDLDDGQRVRTAPGVCVGGHIKQTPDPPMSSDRPDPASIDAAMMGGILANNSRAWGCGVVQNSITRWTAFASCWPMELRATARSGRRRNVWRTDRPGLHAGVAALRDELRADGTHRTDPIEGGAEEHHGLHAPIVPRPRRTSANPRSFDGGLPREPWASSPR